MACNAIAFSAEALKKLVMGPGQFFVAGVGSDQFLVAWVGSAIFGLGLENFP